MFKIHNSSMHFSFLLYCNSNTMTFRIETNHHFKFQTVMVASYIMAHKN